jgi:hypothetical protein
MKTMRPENSFPQICVVSVSQFQEIDNMAQEYRRSGDFSNTSNGLMGNLI